MSLESIDGLDHVIFVYRARGRWGSVARSRDPGLHGRRPVFRTLRQLALTYFEPFVDKTGCLKAYGAVDLRVLGTYDWRLSSGNVWKVERLLFEIPHRPIRSSPARVARLRAKYFAFIAAHPGRKPIYYDRRRGANGRGRTSIRADSGRGRSGERRPELSTAQLAPQSRSKSRCGFVIGLVLGLPERFFEALRQRVAARLLGLHGLLEQRVAPGLRVRQDLVRVVELRLVRALGLDVADDALAGPRR